MITKEQRELRRKFLGSSDIAAICGVDPWRNAASVYVSKVMQLDDTPSEAMATGTRLEGALLDWAQERLGAALVRDQFRTRGVFAANHDALVDSMPHGVEAKTVGIVHNNGSADAEWGDEGTDEIPDHVMLQCQHQMMVSDLELVWVPALIGGRGWRMYRVDRSEDLIATIAERGLRFWNHYVVPRVPPPDQAPALEVAKAVKREAGKRCQLTADIVERWTAAKEALAAAEREREAAEALLLTYMADAEAADTPLGEITYRAQTTRRIDSKRLQVELPDIAAKYQTASTFRVLRWKPAKK